MPDNAPRLFGHRPIPRAFAYPSDYELARAARSLMRDYGMHGAINRLIEMAERLEREEDPHVVLLCRRIER